MLKPPSSTEPYQKNHLKIRIDRTLEELEALAALCAMPHLGPVKIRLLLKRFGSACQAIQAEPLEIAELPGFNPKIMSGWKTGLHQEAWQRDLELAHKLGVHLIPFNSPEYPKGLLELPDHPVLLYVMGSLTPQDRSSIAIVGTRHPSIYGLEMAEKIGHDLAARQMTVVSGLARGIDTAAHKGALSAGRTLAVIGSGLANVYPQENWELAKAIAKNGALISEFPMATPPDRLNFPQRNRIVSGMTLGTLLIEAPLKSGAMITMDRGKTQGRPLFALPGRADGENFQGNHDLIKRGHAQLVENAQDILTHYQDLFALPSKSYVVHNNVFLEKEEEEFLKMLPVEETSIEELEQRTKLPIRKIHVLLMSLIIKRIIKEYPGKVYKKMTRECKENPWANR